MAENQNKTVETVLAKVDLVELISETTPLEKKGKNHFGLCPFHHEKTPSFSVNEEKQLYHCFSCKASGNAITYVKETKNVSSAEALKILAERVNVEINQDHFQSPKQKYYDINQEALNFYKVTLNHTKAGADALAYLEKRKITKQLIDYFEIGLAPQKPDALYQALQKKEILLSDMVDLGLVREDDTVYDIFKNRIMFPLHDATGNIIGFSGRIFNSDAKLAKYMNTQTTPVFEKNKVLYNYHRAQKAIAEANTVVVFEGFMDVIAAHQAGVKASVAVMGTALTKSHIQLLKQKTNRVILCFDGDQAGIDATRKFMKDFEAAQFEVKVVELPEGLDPDDYIQKYGPRAFQKQIKEALSSREFVYKQHKAQVDLERITDIEHFKKRIFDMIAPLSNVEKNHFLALLSSDLNMSLELLEQDFNETKRKHLPTFKKVPKVEITDKFKKAERGFIRYFLKDEYYVRKFRAEFEAAMFGDKNAREIELEILEYYSFNKHTCMVPELFMSKLNATLQAYFKRYVLEENYPFDEKEFEDYLRVMREQNKRNEIESLQRKLESAKTLNEKIELKKAIDQLNKEAKHGQRKNYSRIN